MVGLRTDDGRLLVIMTAAGEVVAEHILVAPGEASVRDEHYGGPRPDVPRRAVRPKTAAEKEFCALGPVAEAFITGAAAAGHTRLGPELVIRSASQCRCTGPIASSECTTWRGSRSRRAVSSAAWSRDSRAQPGAWPCSAWTGRP